MNYLVKSPDNKILRLTVVSSATPNLPEEFQILGLESEVNPNNVDLEKASFEEVELQPEKQVLIRAEQIAQDEVLAQEAVFDEDNNELAPAVTYQPAVEAHPAIYKTIPAVKKMMLVEDSDKVLLARQAKANANLEAIRKLREPLLSSIDHEIFIAEDDGQDTVNLRAYRKALRTCTDSLKKANGEAKLSCENLIPDQFDFPTKG